MAPPPGPPGPPGHDWQQPPPAPPQAPPPKTKSRTGLVLGLVGGSLVVVLLLGAGAFFVVGDGLAPERTITVVEQAGGLTRTDDAPADLGVYAHIASAVRAGDVELDSTATSVYETHGEDLLLFYGGTGNIGDPEEFLTTATPVTLRKTPVVTDADKDTKEACATYGPGDQELPYCAWATSNSFGFVAPEDERITEDYDVKKLLGILRSNVERTED